MVRCCDVPFLAIKLFAVICLLGIFGWGTAEAAKPGWNLGDDDYDTDGALQNKNVKASESFTLTADRGNSKGNGGVNSGGDDDRGNEAGGIVNGGGRRSGGDKRGSWSSGGGEKWGWEYSPGSGWHWKTEPGYRNGDGDGVGSSKGGGRGDMTTTPSVIDK